MRYEGACEQKKKANNSTINPHLPIVEKAESRQVHEGHDGSIRTEAVPRKTPPINTQKDNMSKLVDAISSRGFRRGIAHLIKHVSYIAHIHIYIPFARSVGFRQVRSFYGPKFSANHLDLTFRLYLRASYGFYLSDILKSQDAAYEFLDIGANQGLYSVIAAQSEECHRVWCFEPVQSTFNLLQKNIALNGCQRKVNAFNIAISKHPGTSVIAVSSTHTGAASMDRADEGTSRQTINCIDAVGLEALIRPETRLIVKIDTEGHEPVIIDQLRNTSFWPQVERLFFEVDTRWVDGTPLIEQLMQEGFKEVFRSEGSNHYDVMLARQST